jgi:hypothetical protein
MALQDIEQLRGLTDGAEGFEDADLQAAIDREGGVKEAAVHIWRVKAGSYHSLVDVSESGSTRALSNLQKQALQMADNLSRDIAAANVTVETPLKRTRRAVRR